MAVADVYNLKNEKISEVDLRDDIFSVPVKVDVLHQVVVSQLAARRSGNAVVKTRAEVKGSGAKLWRQKGTGRARAGNAASPTRKGGGVAFGPSQRSYKKKINKKVGKSALCMALTDKMQNEQLTVVDSFDLSQIKTKVFADAMSAFDVRGALIVTGQKSENLEKSSRNVPRIKVMPHEGMNVYDILKYDHLFLEQSAIEKIEEALVA
jgi:large subunit ribosomal protein L4